MWLKKYTDNEDVTPEKNLEILWSAARWPFNFLVIMWAIQLIGFITPFSFYSYGILPRTFRGLYGILTGPFVHGSWGHLASNSVPFFATAFVINLFYKKNSALIIAMIWILTGFSVWLFAKPAYHIGASGVVYGMVSYIFWAGVFNWDRKSIVLALIILFLYSGMFIGILPNQPGISWESHLLGGLVGILVAYLFKTPREEDPWKEEEDSSVSRPFFRSDTFDSQQDYWNHSYTEK